MSTRPSTLPSSGFRGTHQDFNNHLPINEEFDANVNQHLGQVRYYQNEDSNHFPSNNEPQKVSQVSWLQAKIRLSVIQTRNILVHYVRKYKFLLPFLVLLLSLITVPLSFLMTETEREWTHLKSFPKENNQNPQHSLPKSALTQLRINSFVVPAIKFTENQGHLEEDLHTKYHGSDCETIYRDSFLTSLPNSELNMTAEEVDEFKQKVEKDCPTDLEGVNPEIYYNVIVLNNLHERYEDNFKWLRKVEEVLALNPSRPQNILTMIQSHLILSGQLTQERHYALSEINLKKAEELLKKCKTESSEALFAYLKNWLNQNFFELYFQKYSSLDVEQKDQRAFFYQQAEKYFPEIMEYEQNETLLQIFINNLAKISIDEGKIEKAASLINEAILKLSDAVDKTIYQQHLKVLNQILQEINSTSFSF